MNYVRKGLRSSKGTKTGKASSLGTKHIYHYQNSNGTEEIKGEAGVFKALPQPPGPVLQAYECLPAVSYLDTPSKVCPKEQSPLFTCTGIYNYQDVEKTLPIPPPQLIKKAPAPFF